MKIEDIIIEMEGANFSKTGFITMYNFYGKDQFKNVIANLIYMNKSVPTSNFLSKNSFLDYLREEYL